MQVVEIRGPPLMRRADGQLAAHGLRRLRCRLHARIGPVVGAHVVVRAQDDLPVGIPFPRHAGHGFEVPGIEGHKAGMARGKMQTGGCGVALGNQQRPVVATVLCRDGKVAARRFAALEKELVLTAGGLFGEDEL